MAMLVACSVHIQPTTDDSSNISGILRLSQRSLGSPTIIEGEIKGLSPGKHAISIHCYGDLSTARGSGIGKIYNPFRRCHGDPQDAEDKRMVGDLGNLEVAPPSGCESENENDCDQNKNRTLIKVWMEDQLVRLTGPHSVIGRSIVIYNGEDDGGRGDHDLTLINGNCGEIIAAGVIGIADTSDIPITRVEQ
mmetsp:Transcript_33105/g.47889  ORF Transcript_33105/g.47889 Transcript_33105/m.47889 type:complete len:192 (-) Transcript_33105:647-1222(-)